MLRAGMASTGRTVETRGGRQLFSLRRKPDPRRVTWDDIRQLKDAAVQEGNYRLFEDCSKALHIGFRNNFFYRTCEFEVRRRRLAAQR
jgi:hypothetical protein